MQGILASLAAHWPTVIIVTLVSAALGYAAFILRNWKIALAAIVLFGWYVDRQHQYAEGYNAHVAIEVATQTKILNDRIAALQDATAKDAMRAEQDAAEIAELRKRAEATPDNSQPALPEDVVKRIGEIR